MNPTPQQIKEKRLEKNLTQAYSSKLMGVSYSTWRKWESGTHKMREALWDAYVKKIATF